MQVRNDILSRFMAKDLACDGEVYDDKKLRDVCINFIVAGRDTTAVTLSWFFSELCKHPEVVNNILAEVSEVFLKEHESVQNGKQNKTNCNGISFQGLGDQILEFAQKLNYQNLAKLHYLHAALTEALRLYPAVPLVNTSPSPHLSIVPTCTPSEIVSHLIVDHKMLGLE
jgi:cytochrome P450